MQDKQHQGNDSDDLAAFGYNQKLHRKLGGFSSFAAGFSYISILTGMFQLFGLGYGFGGPGIVFAWIFVLFGQMMVALNFAELGARFPVAGSVYQWSKHLGSRGVSWMAGWTMLIGSVVTVAAVSIALQVVLPSVWSGFQVFDSPTTNAVFFGSLLIVLTTIVNVAGVSVMSKINNVGVVAELVGVVLIIVLLFAHATRGPDVITTTQGAGPGLPGYESLGYLAAMLLAAIMPAYVMYGFDTACSLAEETRDPRKKTPWAVLQALGAAGIAGLLLLFGALMAAPSLGVDVLGAGGLPLILQSVLGSTVGKILLVDVAIAICVCTLAIHTASIRICFAMARDGRLPFSERLAQVSERSKAPAIPAVVTGVVAIAVLVVNISSPEIFLVVTSVAIVIVYLAYLMVTAPLLRQRLRTGWPADQGATGLFFLGRRGGLVVNVLAVAYGGFMAINLIWPRSIIYGDGKAWGGVIFVAVVVGVGLVYYLLVQRDKGHQVSDAHRADGAEAGDTRPREPLTTGRAAFESPTD
jgi:urea carboxylase system permease